MKKVLGLSAAFEAKSDEVTLPDCAGVSYTTIKTGQNGLEGTYATQIEPGVSGQNLTVDYLEPHVRWDCGSDDAVCQQCPLTARWRWTNGT